MSEQKRSRTGTRRTTMAVLEILKTSTSLGRPISITQIVKLLNCEYGIATSRDSVKVILDDLMEYYPGPDRIRCKKSEKGKPYSFDYYYQTELPEPIQKNIQAIEQVIHKNKGQGRKEYGLVFQFNGYGTDHQLHPTGKTMEVCPIRTLWAYGHPYLVGFFSGRLDAAHFRIDLMSNIRVTERTREEDPQRDFRIGQVEEEDYQASHLYMFYEHQKERPKQIKLRVKKIPGKPEASMTFMEDHFGSCWRAVEGTETENAVEVWVRCLPVAMAQFVRQYIDRVHVLEPKDVVEQVENALMAEYQAYFQRKV